VRERWVDVDVVVVVVGGSGDESGGNGSRWGKSGIDEAFRAGLELL